VQCDNGLFTTAALDNQYRACATALPIRSLVRTNVSADAAIPNQATTVDPRPAAGSVLWTTNRNAPGGGFFEPANYRGAFGGTDWTQGWTKVSRHGYAKGCDPGVSDVVPGEVGELSFVGKEKLSWSAVQPVPGSGVVYDVLSSGTATSFTTATLLETDDADTNATVDVNPTAGNAFFLLVRAGNECGDGTLGQASDGTVRPGP
jgi:hypothetical protein